MGDAAQYQHRWRSNVRLKSILDAWGKLPKRERTVRTLLLATDAARLSRTFVAEKVKDMLALLGESRLTIPGAELLPLGETNDDAGDE